MIPELGHLALILALVLALAQSVFGLAGAQRRDASWMGSVRPIAYGQFLFVLISFGCLMYSFAISDFTVAYVAENSNTQLPLFYKLAAVWGAHEGSLLLWILILNIWTAAVARFSHRLPIEFTSRVLGVMGVISVGFLLFSLTTSNPFFRLLPPPVQGRDLNPILQDPALVLHPPMLYMGYVGFSVAFAFAVAALIGGKMDAIWARWSRPWTTGAWLFLSAGITLGSWWSYYELGWGGWWFWDPVENASFMPWLAGTALIHSLAVTEKRGAFKSWTALLAIVAFSLSLLGTFLVRSGVLVSVHSFAISPARGIFVLGLIGVVTGVALALYAWRAPALAGSGGGFKAFSRETFLLLNNILLVVAAAGVLLGTLYPLVLEALNLGKISVGPPYFNRVFLPLIVPLFLVIGIGPYVNWKRGQGAKLRNRLALPAAVAIGAAALTAIAGWTDVSLAAVAGVGLGVWVLGSALVEPFVRLRQRRAAGRSLRVPRHILGMSLAHFGAGLVVLGITVTSTLSVVQNVSVKPGETVRAGGYAFTFRGVHEVQGPNYTARQGLVKVTYDNDPVATLRPEKRAFTRDQTVTTEAAIDDGLFRDLYVALGDPLGGGAWSLRVQYKPMVRFIWLGGLVMALGGLLALTDRRYRARGKVAAGLDDAVADTPFNPSAPKSRATIIAAEEQS
ncbi:MAG TPA: heme lyase CcmF/NrfE family subunit [Gammaproteobacteria bacterium]|nr:heme lyase CcmF/NrfE family subunit [Gammaproteobacteria bacterium]